MSVFATGLRTLFHDPNLSVSGTYTSAAGNTKAVRVLYVEASDNALGSAATMGVIAQQDAAELLQSEVPAQPVRGASLAFQGRTFSIRSGATSQKRGLTWRVVLGDA